MAPPLRKGSALLRQRVSGVAFLAVIIGLVLLTVAVYQKRFTPVVMVDLKADRIGNQLTPGSDVKVRGLIVGEVRSVSSTGDGATLQLAIDPGQAKMLPTNVSARLLPKTLFGEKYVALQLPPAASGQSLHDGDVIPQDRSSTSIETERVLTDFEPLLKSLKPEDLSYTLNALSSALRGRGNAIGDNLARTDAYLAQINPQLPTLQKDMQGLADLGDTFTSALPDLLTVLDNSSFSSRSLVDQRNQLDTFLKTTSGFSDTFRDFLSENRNRFVDLALDSKSSLQVLRTYSPEFPCLTKGLTETETEAARDFGGEQPGLHITLETGQKDLGGYVPGEEPKYRENRGPSCYGLNKHIVPFTDYYNPQDGYMDGAAVDPKTGRTKGDSGGGVAASSATSIDPVALFTSPSSAQSPVRAALAPVLGTPAADVPDVATLLFGAMAEGTTIHLS